LEKATPMTCARISAGLILCCAPALAFAFKSIEELPWPSQGKFPAYPMEEGARRPTYFWVQGGAMRDDNLFRLSDGANTQAILGTSRRSDTVWRLGAGVRSDLRISRQQVLLDARVENNDYQHFSVLDHLAYRARGEWKWVAGPQWSGSAGYGTRRYLADLAEIRMPLKDMVTEHHAFASARYLLTPRWRLRAGLDGLRYEHSAAQLAPLESRATAATVGADYVTPAENSIGGQVRVTDGDFRNREVTAGGTVDNSYKETETSAVVRWHVTGKTSLDARLGHTSRKHDQVPQRDFSGATGRLGFDWTPAGKTLINAAIWRELHSSGDVSASYVLSTGYGLGPSWAPTDKVVLHARWVREERDYRGDPGFVLAPAGPRRSDTFRGVRVAAGYTPIRATEIGVGLDKGERSSNMVNGDYDYTAVSANFRFLF